MIAAIDLTFTEIIFLPAGAIILGVTFYFYMASRRLLLQTIKKGEKSLVKSNIPKQPSKKSSNSSADSTPAQPQYSFKHIFSYTKPTANISGADKHRQAIDVAPAEKSSINALKGSIQQQQHIIDKLQYKIEKLEADNEEKDFASEETEQLFVRLQQLEEQLEDKNAEIEKLRKQEDATQDMVARLQQMNEAFELLQHKMAQLEKKAQHYNEVSSELQVAYEVNATLQQKVEEKEEKLELTAAEKEQLHNSLVKTEKELQHSHIEQSALARRIALLQNINSDIALAASSNKKLKNKMRRISELESILLLSEIEKDSFKN